MVGGGNAAEQDVVQSLDRGTWHTAGHLPTVRSDLSVVDWGRDAYVLGGYDGRSQPTGVLRLDASAPPHQVAHLVRGVRYAATARLGSRVYVIGGEIAGQEVRTIQVVDLETGRVRPAGRLPTPLGHAMAATVAGQILVMGGRVGSGRPTDRVWWFDPATRHVHRAGRLPTPLSDAGVATSGRRIWLLGGETPTVTDRAVVVRVS